jgi:DNA-binding NtrC family response regulator
MAVRKILVIDDEPGVLALVEKLLSLRGYHVFATTDARIAMEKVRDPGNFDLVISDVIMPGICGPELVRRIENVCPGIPAVLMSGNVGGAEIPRHVSFIGKPFKADDLFAVVERALDRSSAASV